jgi:hypothetical protein
MGYGCGLVPAIDRFDACIVVNVPNFNEKESGVKQPGQTEWDDEDRQKTPWKKTRRFPIPPNQPHRDRRNDYRRREKHRKWDDA